MVTYNLAREMEHISSILKEDDIYIVRNRHGLKLVDVDIPSPDIVLTLCHQGWAKIVYDMRRLR